MNVFYIIISGIIYGLISYSAFSYLMFPVEMLCTFLHEFGHAIFCELSGGDVESLCVNTDGSGVTYCRGGSNGLTTIGGYVGSAIFGNVMLYLSSRDKYGITLKILSALMIISSLIWFSNITTSFILIVFGIILFLLSRTKLKSFTLAFLGVASIIYIIQDFNVGPTSDLQSYEKLVGIFPTLWWMYIWLGMVITITSITFYLIFKSKKSWA